MTSGRLSSRQPEMGVTTSRPSSAVDQFTVESARQAGRPSTTTRGVDGRCLGQGGGAGHTGRRKSSRWPAYASGSQSRQRLCLASGTSQSSLGPLPLAKSSRDLRPDVCIPPAVDHQPGPRCEPRNRLLRVGEPAILTTFRPTAANQARVGRPIAGTSAGSSDFARRSPPSGWYTAPSSLASERPRP